MLGKFSPGMSYVHVANIMKEFDSDSRKLQVQSTFKRLKLNIFMSMYSITSLSTGLTKIVEKIEHLTPQCPAGFRSRENKKRFLRGAVITYEWARSLLQSMTSDRYNFKDLSQLYTKAFSSQRSWRCRLHPSLRTLGA